MANTAVPQPSNSEPCPRTPWRSRDCRCTGANSLEPRIPSGIWLTRDNGRSSLPPLEAPLSSTLLRGSPFRNSLRAPRMTPCRGVKGQLRTHSFASTNTTLSQRHSQEKFIPGLVRHQHILCLEGHTPLMPSEIREHANLSQTRPQRLFQQARDICRLARANLEQRPSGRKHRT